jgi:hypothetical protein
MAQEPSAIARSWMPSSWTGLSYMAHAAYAHAALMYRLRQDGVPHLSRERLRNVEKRRGSGESPVTSRFGFSIPLQATESGGSIS